MDIASLVGGMSNCEPIIEVCNLTKHYRIRGPTFARSGQNIIRAVDGVNLSVAKGQTLALVGESGCGKTTMAKLILRLEYPTSGEVLFRGVNIHQGPSQQLSQYRGAVQAVFQDPYSSLSPRMKIADIVAEPLLVASKVPKRSITEMVAVLLQQVGLEIDALSRYPHEFSGGQRQRIAIARAISTNPEVVVLDEPVSALDVSIGAQVMNLLKDMQEERGFSYLLIAHDLATVRFLSHKVAVIYRGKLVEEAPVEELYRNPVHPYTKALLAAASLSGLDDHVSQIEAMDEASSTPYISKGCQYHPRCSVAIEDCRVREPSWNQIRVEHYVACHLFSPPLSRGPAAPKGVA